MPQHGLIPEQIQGYVDIEGLTHYLFCFIHIEFGRSTYNIAHVVQCFFKNVFHPLVILVSRA